MKSLMLAKKGFNTFEFVTVITIIAVVLAIAVPVFVRAKISGNESAAVTNLHKLAAAFEAYRSIYGQYPTSFSQLCDTQPPLIDEQICNSSQKQGYTFTIATGTDVVPTYAFRILAEPTQPRITGVRHFKIGSSDTEANGVAYYAMDPTDPWKPIGYEEPGKEELVCPDGSQPPCIESPCAGQCCSVCNGSGCIICPPPPPPPSSCPYVYVWNGKEFIKDNDIIPAGNPNEYTDYYKLTKAVTLDKQGNALLKIVESLDEKSYLDNVRLLEIIHPAYAKLAPTPSGEFFTFIENKLSHAVKAVDKSNKDVLAFVSTKDKGNYHGVKEDFIVFDFGKIKKTPAGLRLILSSDLDFAYAAGQGARSLHIEVFLDNKAWQEIAIVHPHEAWDIWAIELSKYNVRIKGNLKIKVIWKDEHKLDFVLLDTSKQIPLKVKELALLEAKHSNKKDVLKLISASDNRYVYMKKGDEISLRFLGAKEDLAKKEIRDHIFVSEGFYRLLKR